MVEQAAVAAVAARHDHIDQHSDPIAAGHGLGAIWDTLFARLYDTISAPDRACRSTLANWATGRPYTYFDKPLCNRLFLLRIVRIMTCVTNWG
jgi:hypothetical protein